MRNNNRVKVKRPPAPRLLELRARHPVVKPVLVARDARRRRYGRPNGSTSGLARSVFLPTRMIVRQFRSNASKPLRASMPSRSSARRCHWPGFLEQEKDVGVRATIKRIEIWKLPIWMHPSQLRDELCKWRDMWLVKHSLTKGNGFGRTKRARTIRIFSQVEEPGHRLRSENRAERAKIDGLNGRGRSDPITPDLSGLTSL
jgi:hypothetical protein